MYSIMKGPYIHTVLHTHAGFVMTGPTMRVDVRDLTFFFDWKLRLFRQEWAHHRTQSERHTRRQTERENFLSPVVIFPWSLPQLYNSINCSSADFSLLRPRFVLK